MPAEQEQQQPLVGPTTRALAFAENLVYAAAALFLVSAAVILLVSIGYGLVRELSDGVEPAITHALDGLLLVFILLELLAGVRATMAERKLIAEPFLIVGIIASIKEIVVISLEARAGEGGGAEEFSQAMTEIGVLGGLVVALAVASFLVRRKEREPAEEST